MCIRDRILPGVAAAIRFLALSGCRLGEVLALKWEDIDLGRCVLHLPDAKAGARNHAIGAAAAALLAARRPEDAEGFVFSADPTAPLSRSTVEGAWQRLRIAAELRDARLHDLRPTVGTFAGQTGANAFLIQHKLGHKTLAMTGRYVNQDANPLRVLSDQVEGRIAGALAGHKGEVVAFPQPARTGAA